MCVSVLMRECMNNNNKCVLCIGERPCKRKLHVLNENSFLSQFFYFFLFYYFGFLLIPFVPLKNDITYYIYIFLSFNTIVADKKKKKFLSDTRKRKVLCDDDEKKCIKIGRFHYLPQYTVF